MDYRLGRHGLQGLNDCQNDTSILTSGLLIQRNRHVEIDKGILRICQVVYTQATIKHEFEAGCLVVNLNAVSTLQTEFSFVAERILNDGGRDLMLPRKPKAERIETDVRSDIANNRGDSS